MGAGDGRLKQDESLQSGQTANLCDDRIDWEGTEALDIGDVPEVVNANEIHEPARCPRTSSLNIISVAPLPVITNDRDIRVHNRRDRVTLDVSAADEPPQTGADHEHKHDEPPHAEAQVSSPGPRDGACRHGGHSLGSGSKLS